MADYYPLIARALESLSDKSPETRRAVYDRARAALVDQLRSLRPALPEADITRERLALDDAIARIEAEHTRQPAKLAPRTASAPRPAPARPEPPPASAPRPTPAPAPAPAGPRPTPQGPGPGSMAPRPVPPPPPPGAPRPTPAAAPSPARLDPGPARPAPGSNRPEPGSNRFEPAPSRPEPGSSRPGPLAPAARRPADAPPAAPSPTPAAPPFDLPPVPPRPAPRPQPEPARSAAPVSNAFQDYLPEAGGALEAFEPLEAEPPLEALAPEPPLRPRVQTRGPHVQSDHRMRSIILIASVLTVVLLIAALAVRWKVDPETEFRQQAAATPDAQPSEGQTKFAERVGGSPAAPAPAPAQPPVRSDVSAPQRAIFYEEDPADPQNPKATPGRVTWRLETVNPGQGQPLQAAVRAVVEVPDANLTLNVLIRRNLDATLPASHTIELAFATRPGDEGRIARDVGLLQFKSEEAARGTPVAGLQVPVRENLFLIGLSNLAPNIERNLNLLLHQNWIDLPIRLASGQRAIVSFEKGPTGEQVLNEAYRQWQ